MKALIFACLVLSACAAEPHKAGVDTPGQLDAAERDEMTRLGNENRARVEQQSKSLSPAVKVQAKDVVSTPVPGARP
jgi:hypothetical protein